MTETLDPEVVALVQEIVDDPDSTLLRVPSAPLKRWLDRREPRVSAGEAFLTKAERHLLFAYREAAGRLLWQACGMRVMHRSSVIFAARGEPLEEEAWHLQARRILSGGVKESLREGIAFLSQCFGGAEDLPPSRIAAAALRLLPCDDLRNWLALALVFEEQPLAALRVLHTILAAGPDHLMRSVALENSGLANYSRGETMQAFQCYQLAIQADPDRPEPLLWAFTASLDLGDESAAMTAARRLSEQWENPFIDRALSGLKEARRVQQWRPSSVGLVLARRIKDRLPEEARRVADVYA